MTETLLSLLAPLVAGYLLRHFTGSSVTVPPVVVKPAPASDPHPIFTELLDLGRQLLPVLLDAVRQATPKDTGK